MPSNSSSRTIDNTKSDIIEELSAEEWVRVQQSFFSMLPRYEKLWKSIIQSALKESRCSKKQYPFFSSSGSPREKTKSEPSNNAATTTTNSIVVEEVIATATADCDGTCCAVVRRKQFVPVEFLCLPITAPIKRMDAASRGSSISGHHDNNNKEVEGLEQSKYNTEDDNSKPKVQPQDESNCNSYFGGDSSPSSSYVTALEELHDDNNNNNNNNHVEATKTTIQWYQSAEGTTVENQDDPTTDLSLRKSESLQSKNDDRREIPPIYFETTSSRQEQNHHDYVDDDDSLTSSSSNANNINGMYESESKDLDAVSTNSDDGDYSTDCEKRSSNGGSSNGGSTVVNFTHVSFAASLSPASTTTTTTSILASRKKEQKSISTEEEEENTNIEPTDCLMHNSSMNSGDIVKRLYSDLKYTESPPPLSINDNNPYSAQQKNIDLEQMVVDNDSLRKNAILSSRTSTTRQRPRKVLKSVENFEPYTSIASTLNQQDDINVNDLIKRTSEIVIGSDSSKSCEDPYDSSRTEEEEFEGISDTDESCDEKKEKNLNETRTHEIINISSSEDEEVDQRSLPPKRKPTKKVTQKSIKSGASFRRNRVELANAAFQEFDHRAFAGALTSTTDSGEPVLTLAWSNKLRTTAGLTRLQKKRTVNKQGSYESEVSITRTVVIELSEKVIDSEEKLRSTMLHELCHAAAWIIDNNAKPPHGRCFKKWASKAMRCIPNVEVTTTHQYEISYKYAWACSNSSCNVVIQRHSRSLDIDRKVCGRCRGRLVEIQVPSSTKPENGILDRTPRKKLPPSAYNLFVKDNSRSVRRTLERTNGGSKVTQPEVMKECARLWKETQNQES